MARSPWRDAIDGKVKVLRDLRGRGAKMTMAAYVQSSSAFSGGHHSTSQTDISMRAYSIAMDLLRRIHVAVQIADPIYLTHDITHEIMRRPKQKDHLNDPLDVKALPMREGFIWFPEPVAIVNGVPNDTGPEVIERDLYIRGMYFGVGRSIHAYNADDIRTSEGQDTLGLVIFADTHKSGWLIEDAGGGPGQNWGDLIPFMCVGWKAGHSLHQRTELLVNTAPDRVDMVLQVWPYVFISRFFDLLAQRTLLIGGTAIDRDTRKEAERNDLEAKILVVTWRKANYIYPAGHIPVPRDWSCRWSVREHTRRLKSGRIIQVKGHVKGPEHKPFKQPNINVHFVKR